MFWGLIMDPNKRYTQTVEKAFHVSMASLDTTAAGNNIVQVKLCYEGLSYLLCSLQKGQTWQVPLDLNFQEGTEISFTSNDKVHLTGYLIPEDGMDMGDLEDEEDEEEEEEEDEEVPQLVGKQTKRKAQESPKDSKKLKKLKAALQQDELSSDDDEDDDDLDESLEVEGEDDSDDLEDEAGEEEDDSEEEEEVEVKPQQKKQKQKEQQQANKKQEKQKLVNGKSATPEQTKPEKKKGKGEQQQQQQQQQQKKGKGEQQQQQQNNAQQAQKKRVLEGGVQVEDVKVGNGPNAKPGKFIAVHYIGRLSNGKKFDSTTQGEGFKFRLGKGEVIKGWDVGIAGMKVGGKRRITIPPGMAYGAKGSGSVIPGNSTLVFEVELKNVH